LLVPALLALLTATAICAQQTNYPKDYKGTPYQDNRYQGGAQKIPGKVECAYYDRAGEGVAITTPIPKTTAAES
jgi:hypothetical protein